MPYVAGTVSRVSSVRGACPTVHEPFLAADGALVRVHVPGGLLSAAHAEAVAEVSAQFGSGVIEITNRANLQLRGIEPHRAPALAAALIDARLAHPDPQVEASRSVLASPTAGVDPAQVADARPVVARVVTLLERSPVALPPKFSVFVDCGERVHVRGRRATLSVVAVESAGSVRFEVRRAGPPADGTPPPTPVGIRRARQCGRTWVGAVPALGRLDAATFASLAALGEFRITPWRSILYPDVANDDAASLVRALRALGLACAPEDPETIVIACSGIVGCAAGLVDTIADARALIERLRETPVEERPRSVHFSGCEKRCATRDPCDVTFLGVAPGRYERVARVRGT